MQWRWGNGIHIADRAGIGTAAAAAAVLAVFHRKNRAVWAFAAVLLALTAGVSAAVLKAQSGREQTEEQTAASGEYLEIAYGLMEQGAYEEAGRTLEEYLENSFYSEEYVLARARLYGLQKNYGGARALYRQLLDKKPDAEEKSALEEELESVSLAAEGEEGAAVRTAELLGSTVEDAAADLSDAVLTAVSCFAKGGEETDPETSPAELAEELEKAAEKAPQLFQVTELARAKLRAQAVAGAYETIAREMDGWEDSEQLLLFSELYRRDLIRSSMLAENEALREKTEQAELALDWLTAQRNKHAYTEKELALLDGAVEELERTARGETDSYDFWVRDQLLETAGAEGEEESSKLYMQASRLAYDEGEEDEAASCLDKALQTGGQSGDGSYLGPMNELNRILEDKENTEALKEIDTYAVMAVENLVDVPALPETAEEEALAETPEQETENAAGWLFGGGQRDETDGAAEDPSGDAGADDEIQADDEARADGKTQTDGEARADGKTQTDGEARADGKMQADEETQTDADDAAERPASSEQEFAQYVTDYVNQRTAAVSITGIDTSEFETVKAVVALDESIADTEEAFKENIRISDCGVEIADYDVKKVTYSEVNILLCCDNSGSMDGEKIENLRQAVSTFVDNLEKDVKIGLVPFDSGVLSELVCEPGTDSERLNECVAGMKAGGGTNIYSSVEYALSVLSGKTDSMNVVILMSDGQDGLPSEESIQQITSACESSGTAIYAMGLGGDVDSSVLSAYADAGNGEYVFVSDSNSLLSFYQYIYQLSKNRYEVTYTAADTMKVSRTLRAEAADNAQVYDERPYYLYESAFGEEDLGEEYELSVQDAVLYGLDTRLLYQSAAPQSVCLEGKDLGKERAISVKLHGTMEYELECAYESDERWRVTVPAHAACGVYDVYVTVDGARAVFSSGLVIAGENMNTVRFGEYVFSSTGIETLGDTTRLTGYVMMNNWLGFTQGVSLTGDLEKDTSVTLTCQKTYIQYRRGEAEGYAGYLAEHGMYAGLPQFSRLTLYNDPTKRGSSEEYPVDTAVAEGAYVLLDFFELNTAGVSLYPDRAVVDFRAFDTAFPFQDAALKSAGLDKLFSFSLDDEEKLIFNRTQVGCDISVKLGNNDTREYRALFGNMPIYCNLGEAELSINTIDGDISVKVLANIAMLADGLGIKLAWSGWELDEVLLYADVPINTSISGVPVTFDNFSLGVKDLKAVEQFSFGELMKAKLTGSFDVSMAKISAIKPGLENWIGDVSAASLEDVTLEFRLNQFYISVAAKAKLLSVIELGSCKIELGQGISYTNLLLGMEGETVNGFNGKVNVGIKMETNNCALDVGASAQLTLTDRVLGLTAGGKIHAQISWWILVADFNAEGEAFVGWYEQHNGAWVFGVHGRGYEGGSNSFDLVWGEEDPGLASHSL